MKEMKILALACMAALFFFVPASAQEEVQTSIGVDLVSHYAWRGTSKGSFYIQPTAEVKWQGATLKLLGSTGVRRDEAQEIDINLEYKWKDFNFGITDYWETGNDYDGRNLYFYYDPHRSAHQFEINAGYTHELFTVQAYTMVWGNDFKYTSLQDQIDMTGGKRAFSTYAEVRVPFYLGGLDWDVSAGFTPFESANSVEQVGEVLGLPLLKKNHFYAKGPACVMAALRLTKNYELGDVKVPFFAELHTNPYMQKAYFLVGVSIIPFK